MPNPYSESLLDLPYSDGVTTTDREVKKLMEEAKPAWEDQYGTSRFIDKDLGLFAKRKFADRIEEIPDEISEYNRVFTDPFLDQHGFNRNLSPDDKVLIESYAQGYDHLINRRPRIDDEGYNREFYENDIIPSFENLITKNKLKNDTSVARSMKDHFAKVERNGEEMRIRMSELQDGDIYIPESFLSTSLYRQNNFGDMMFDINLPKGQSYLVPNATRRSPFPNEQELVLPSKLKFKYESTKADNSVDIRGLDELELNKLYPGGIMRTKEGIMMNNTLIPTHLAVKRERNILQNIRSYPTGKLTPINPYLMIPGAGILGATQMNNEEEPKTYQQGGLIREDGTMKGKGFFGAIPTSGGHMTEVSRSFEWNGKENLVPSLVPGLTAQQILYLQQNKGYGGDDTMNEKIDDNAYRYARLRESQNQPFFATPEEEGKLPPPSYQQGGTIKSQLNNLAQRYNTM